jgi:hypothetical protein
MLLIGKESIGPDSNQWDFGIGISSVIIHCDAMTIRLHALPISPQANKPGFDT